MPVQIVDQKEDLVFDRSLFERWLRFSTDSGNCLELGSLLRSYLHGVLGEDECASSESENHPDDTRPSPVVLSELDAVPPAWYGRAWRASVLAGVRSACRGLSLQGPDLIPMRNSLSATQK